MNKRPVIFTDLDGTLLDSRYTYGKATAALKKIREKNIPLVLCSSKTRAEIERWRKRLENKHPFISENGGGIYVPVNYFRFPCKVSGVPVQKEDGYCVIKLGASYDDLRAALVELRAEGFDVRGFGDMKAGEVAALTGLGPLAAGLAKKRDFDEPFVFRGSERSLSRLKRRIKIKGFNVTQGEIFHIMGDSDKGRAVEILISFYKRQYKGIVSAALGDSPNDIEMLQKVDHPFVVQKNDGSYHPGVIKNVKGIIRADGVGPEGWSRAVTGLLETLVF